MEPQLKTLARNVLGNGDFAANVVWLLDIALPLAEQVLTEQGLGRAKGMFMLLQPTEVFRSKQAVILRPHYLELCERYKRGEDTRPGTKAEVLAGLLGASLIAPLNNTANALINQLGVEVLGRDFEIPHHSNPEAIEDAFEFCQRKLYQRGRGLPRDRDEEAEVVDLESTEEPVEAILESMGLSSGVTTQGGTLQKVVRASDRTSPSPVVQTKRRVSRKLRAGLND